MYAALCMLHGFCLHLCTALRTYTDSSYVCERLLRTLYGFCVRIQLIFWEICAYFAYVYSFLCALSVFAYVYGLYLEMFDADRLEVSELAYSLICFVYAIARDPLTFSRIRSWLFCRVHFLRKLLVIIGPSRESNLEGSVEFLSSMICSLWLDHLKDPIVRVPSSSLSNEMHVIHRPILLWKFLCSSW